jgi:hypothetical protein
MTNLLIGSELVSGTSGYLHIPGLQYKSPQNHMFDQGSHVKKYFYSFSKKEQCTDVQKKFTRICPRE